MSIIHIVLLADTKYSADVIDFALKLGVGISVIFRKRSPDEPSNCVCDDVYVVDEKDYCAEILSAFVRRICEKNGVRSKNCFLLCFNESSVLVVGEVVDRTGCIGVPLSQALLFRDKWLMMQAATRCGVPTPWTQRADIFDPRFDSDVIIKPRHGTASRDAHRLSNHAQWEDTIRHIGHNLQNYIVQEFVDAPMFHVDGVIIDRVPVIHFCGGFLTSQLEAGRQSGAHFKSWLTMNESPHRSILVKAHDCVVAGFGLEHGCTHMEFFVRGGEVLLCEAACRPPGMDICKLHKLACNSSSVELFLKYLIGKGSKPSCEGVAGLLAFTTDAPATIPVPIDLFLEPYIYKTIINDFIDPMLGSGYLHELGRLYIRTDSIERCAARLDELDQKFQTWFQGHRVCAE